jgi:hypothetical protein
LLQLLIEHMPVVGVAGEGACAQRFAFGFLQIPSLAQNTLAVQLTLPLVGRVEDFHLQVSAPCRAHP